MMSCVNLPFPKLQNQAVSPWLTPQKARSARARRSRVGPSKDRNRYQGISNGRAQFVINSATLEIVPEKIANSYMSAMTVEGIMPSLLVAEKENDTLTQSQDRPHSILSYEDVISR